MSDYRIICTALPHGPYEPGRMRLTLLLHPQYKGKDEVRLSSLGLIHKWTANLNDLLQRSSAKAVLRFYKLGAAGSAETPALFNVQVALSRSRLQPDIWSALFADDPPVRSADTPEPVQQEQPEFQSYSQAAAAANLLTSSVDIAAGIHKDARSPIRSFDLAGGDYPDFPGANELAKAHATISPFVLGACNLHEQEMLLREALRAAEGSRTEAEIEIRRRVERDIARLKRFNPNAGLKSTAVNDIVSIHGGGMMNFAGLPQHLAPSQEEMAPEISEQRRENIKALLFHRPIHNQDSHHIVNQIDDAPTELDFHERLSVYGNQPAILRPLGLAFDLEFGLEGHHSQLASPATYLVWPDLKALLGGLSPEVEDQSVYTAFNIRSVGGRDYCVLATRKDTAPALAGSASHRDGMFDFKDRSPLVRFQNRSRYALISSEPVATLLRITFASYETEEADDLPNQKPHHLRGAGLVLVTDDRDRQASDDLEGSKSAAQDLVFFSEDLVLGYRVDVQRYRSADGRTHSAPDRWRSLCERTSVYKIVNRKGDTVLTWTPDGADETINEGFIDASAYTRLPDSDKLEYQANSALFRWDNWSLSVPLPLEELGTDCDEIKRDPGDGPPQFSGLSSVHAVKKRSLPKLEYGDGYRVRMRVVDLAGNSYSPDEAPGDEPFVLGAPESAQQPYIHKRAEPVGVPEVLLAKAFHAEELPGEQLTHMVIRGAGGVSAEGARGGVSGRFLVPPRVPQQFAEMHGVAEPFDPARGAFFDSGLNPDGPYLEMRPDGTFIRACDIWGECDEPPGCVPVKADKKNKQNPDADNPVYKFTTRRGQAPPNPFFPDPAARFARILLRGNKPGGKTVRYLDFDFYRRGKWPNVIPFGVQLHGTDRGDSRMEWLRSSDPDSRRRGDGAGDILAVYLPPSQTAHLLIHCLPSLKSDLGQEAEPFAQRAAGAFALSDQLLSTLKSRGKALAGDPNLFQHWAVSAPLILKLVHAVERPLKAPGFTDLCIKYAADKPCPRNPQELLAQNIASGSTAVWLAGAMECHQRSTGRLEVIAHWEEPFDDLNKSDYDPTPVRHTASVFVKHLSTDESESQQQVFALPDDLRHDFGDTRYREVAYGIEASSRFKEYFPTVENDDAKRFVVATPDDNERQLTVLSRARPSLCFMNRVVPAFRWSSSPGEGKRDVIRERQCYARVWIERPWFSSGAGEKLGVVLLPSGQRAAEYNPEKVGPFVSLWGTDPLWASPQINRTLSSDDFAGYAGKGVGLRLEEADLLVDVVGYDVHYSKERHMWYADIQVNPNGSYFPFVRLAVARYQPHSIPGVELSGVVLADPVQVFPARRAKVVREDSRSWVVSVEGTSFNLSPERPKGNEMVFSIVERRSEDDTDAGWVTSRVKGQPIRVVATPTGPAEASLWKSTLSLPDRGGRTRYAIMVEELETWKKDKEIKKGQENPPAPIRRSFEEEFTTRLVYADRIELK